MAYSAELTKTEAIAISAICNAVAEVLAKIDVVLEHNSDLAIDWGAATTPGYITEDADGNISGLTFDRASVANAIGSLDQARKLFTNQDVAQGDHLGNINKLARAMPLR
jgi:uncharacterized protein YdbL (DUF1318 family)